MKTASTALKTLLGEYLTGKRHTYYIAELYTFWLNYGLSYNAGYFNNGKILTYTGHDTDLMVGGNTYQHWSIDHGDIQEKKGVETNDTSITVNYNPYDVVQNLGTTTWFSAVQSGMFDDCYVSIDRLFSPTQFVPMMGNISSDYVLKARFFGRIDVDECKLASCKFTVKDSTELLNTQLPRNEVIPTCVNTFCDGMCTLNKQDYALTVSAQAGSSKAGIWTGCTLPDGYFAQGSMLCLSGNNIGTTRPIKTYVNNFATPTNPWGLSVATGDEFILYRGCAKTMAACSAYGNLTHYRGFPFLPVANTLL